MTGVQTCALPILAEATDITALKRAETELAQSQKRWSHALESAGQGVWEWSRDKPETQGSRTWKMMRGYALDELMGRLTFGEAIYLRNHVLARLDVAAAFEAGSGVTALFGRSGCGKSTAIALIAGLLAPDAGRITLDGEVLVDRDENVDVDARHRRN